MEHMAQAPEGTAAPGGPIQELFLDGMTQINVLDHHCDRPLLITDQV